MSGPHDVTAADRRDIATAERALWRVHKRHCPGREGCEADHGSTPGEAAGHRCPLCRAWHELFNLQQRTAPPRGQR